MDLNEGGKDLIYVDICGKQIIVDEDIPISFKDDITTESIEVFLRTHSYQQ